VCVILRKEGKVPTIINVDCYGKSCTHNLFTLMHCYKYWVLITYDYCITCRMTYLLKWKSQYPSCSVLSLSLLIVVKKACHIFCVSLNIFTHWYVEVLCRFFNKTGISSVEILDNQRSWIRFFFMDNRKIWC